jgi:bifunctional enzyme CysN/CysC
MDRLGFAPEPFERVVAAFAAFAARLQFEAIAAIPISARDGDNVARPSPRTPWYAGPTLIAHLEGVDAAGGLAAQPMRFPVQWVNRPDAGFRGLAGTVVSGALEAGAEVAVAPSGAVTRVARIVTAEGDRARAEAGEAVTLVLTDELDVARGDLIAPARARPAVADQFAAHLVWLGREALLPGRGYEMRIGTRWTRASVSLLKHKLSVDDLDELAARTLVTNEIGFANLAVATPVAFDPYAENRDTGAFILVDRVTNETVAAGMIAHALRRASNIHHEALALDKAARSALKHQRATVLWFTGLPASGKSTVAKLVEAQLAKSGQHTMMLDGDNLRHGLNRDLGFTDADRVENVRRVGEVAKLMTEAGLIVLCAFISPFRAERRMVREMFDAGEFLEIFVDAPLEACIARDPKGLYAKARAGQIPHFTGIDSPYEAPEAPDLILDTSGDTAEESAGRVMDLLRARARILG